MSTRLRAMEADLTAAWRRYCRLYAADLREAMVSTMARLIAAGTGTPEQVEQLERWTLRGVACEHHERLLCMFRECVIGLWELRGQAAPEDKQLRSEVDAVLADLADLGVEVDEPTPFDPPRQEAAAHVH